MTTSVYDLYDICTPPDICQTPPDMIQTPSDTHRHHPDNPQTQAFLLVRGHWKERQYLSWHDFYTFLPTDLVLIHPQTPPDPSQTLPDTIQTPQDIDIVMQYRALKENAISEYHGLIYFLPTDLVLMPPQTPSDTI